MPTLILIPAPIFQVQLESSKKELSEQSQLVAEVGQALQQQETKEREMQQKHRLEVSTHYTTRGGSRFEVNYFEL